MPLNFDSKLVISIMYSHSMPLSFDSRLVISIMYSLISYVPLAIVPHLDTLGQNSACLYLIVFRKK